MWLIIESIVLKFATLITSYKTYTYQIMEKPEFLLDFFVGSMENSEPIPFSISIVLTPNLNYVRKFHQGIFKKEFKDCIFALQTTVQTHYTLSTYGAA